MVETLRIQGEGMIRTREMTAIESNKIARAL
jgi:hypothetical protein